MGNQYIDFVKNNAGALAICILLVSTMLCFSPLDRATEMFTRALVIVSYLLAAQGFLIRGRGKIERINLLFSVTTLLGMTPALMGL